MLHRHRLSLIGVVAVLIASLGHATASAAPPAQDPAPVVVSQPSRNTDSPDCAKVRRSTTTGMTPSPGDRSNLRTVDCTRTSKQGLHPAGKASGPVDGQAGASAITPGLGCPAPPRLGELDVLAATDGQTFEQFYTRSLSCVLALRAVTLFNPINGQEFGFIDYRVQHIVRLSGRTLEWVHEINFQIERVVRVLDISEIGLTTVSASSKCSGSCLTLSVNFPEGTNFAGAPGTIIRGTAKHVAGLVVKGLETVPTSEWSFVFRNPTAVPPIGPQNVVRSPGHRCDTLNQGTQDGCAYTLVRPVFDIASRVARYPKFARHVKLSIAAGLDRVLSRADSATRRRNTDLACPPESVLPALKRPAGMSCDEYPFASTFEGAARLGQTRADGRQMLFVDLNNGNNYFSCSIPYSLYPKRGLERTGFNVCMIPWEDNMLGGEDLDNFYIDSRVNLFDIFEVRA